MRDRQTAQAYANVRVRFHVARQECAVEGRTLRIWANDRTVPPVIIVACAEPISGDGPFIVVGTAAAPTVDGVSRALRVDFWVAITNATVTQLPLVTH